MKHWHILQVTFVLSLVIVTLLLLPFPTCAEETIKSAITHQVKTVKVITQRVDEQLHVYGRVSFDDTWLQNINLAHGGQIIRLPVLAGEPVTKGQLLAEIVVDPAAAAAYQKAVAAARFSTSELNRIRSLLTDQLATQSQLDMAKRDLSDSQSKLRQLKQQGIDTNIREVRAPFDAVVASIPVQIGQRIAARITLMRLGHPDHLKVLLGMEADDVKWVLPGNRVEIHPAMGSDTTIVATVDKVLHTVNPKTRLVDLLVRLSGQKTQPFLPGMVVSAEVSSRVFPHALRIPRQAMMYSNGSAYVMRVRHNSVEQIAVKVILEMENDVLVQGQLHAGQSIVTTGVAELSNGDNITIDATQ